MDDRVGGLVGIGRRFAARTCHLPYSRRLEQGLSACDRSGDTDAYSLPSVLIIPFMLLAGRLSVTGNKFKLLVVGLTVFFLSGFACLFINQMWLLILVSCLTGIGAGIIIPLSTGYIVDYFTGDYRVRQLGYSSSINNLTLVLATVLASYLANVDWHLPFLVYTLPAIPLILSIFIRRTPAAPEPVGSDELKHKKIDWPKLAAVMGFLFSGDFPGIGYHLLHFHSWWIRTATKIPSRGFWCPCFSWLSCCPAFSFPRSSGVCAAVSIWFR